MKIIVLKLNDIREWLNDNCDEYQKLKTLDFPPIDNEVYWMYNNLYEFISFYSYSHKCSKALIELKLISDFNFLDIIKWTQVYEVLGSQQLCMFEVNYCNWTENVKEGVIKIHKGLFTERKPFDDIICFCKVFQLLYWIKNIHKTIYTDKEQLGIYKNLKFVFDNYCFENVQK